MVKLQKMQIKCVGTFMVLVFSCFLGTALGERKVIQGLVSGLKLTSAPEESHQALVDILANKCRLELIHFKQIYEDLGIGVPEVLGITEHQVLLEENVHKTLSILDPNIKQSLYNCLRENYLISPVLGEDAKAVGWFQKHLRSLVRTFDPPGRPRRYLAEAPAHAPTHTRTFIRAEAPSPKHSGSKSPSSKQNAPLPSDSLVISIPIPTSSSSKDGDTADSGSDTADNQSDNHKTLIIAVSATALATFLIAAILFFCCRKAFGGGSGLDHKDDRPLLSLSMSDYSISGPKPNAWASQNADNKGKNSNQLYPSYSGHKTGAVSSDNNFSISSPTEVSDSILSIPSPIEASRDSSSMSDGTNTLSSGLRPPPGTNPLSPVLKPPPGTNTFSSGLRPPPGRTGVSAPEVPPSKSPVGKTDPLPSEPPASLRPSTMGGQAPPPPGAPAVPPPPKKSGPPPPGPPPPPGGKGGPRAPPPPKGGKAPPLKGKAGSSSGGEDNAAKAKLKPFFWDKVNANPDQSMVWDQLKSGSFQFNEEMIESLFGYAAAENVNQKKKDSASRDPPPQFIQLIEPKKAQNLSILLRALNVTTEEVRDALEEGNELPSELIETLLKMGPTAEEELKLRLFTGDISKLGPAERFLKVMVDIPFAFKRMESLLYMCSLHEEAKTVKDNFATLEAACKELRSSRLFFKLLEAVLKTGNRMNDGTYRGGAQAFKLDTLLKLADVRGTDGKTTLLHFVVQEMVRSEGVRAVRAASELKSVSSIKSEDLLGDETEDSEEHYRSLGLQVVSGLGDQLQNVRNAACLDSDGLTGAVSKIGSGLIRAKNFLNKEMKEVDAKNGFHQALKSFVMYAETDVMRLLEEEKRIMALIKSTGDYFHGNTGKEEGLRLFVIVRDFTILLEKVCREVKARPKWPGKTKKRDPPSRQTSSETPRTPNTPDFRQQLFPAIAERRQDGGSSSDDD